MHGVLAALSRGKAALRSGQRRGARVIRLVVRTQAIARADPRYAVALRNHGAALVDVVHIPGVDVLKPAQTPAQPDQAVLVGIAELGLNGLCKRHVNDPPVSAPPRRPAAVPRWDSFC